MPPLSESLLGHSPRSPRVARLVAAVLIGLGVCSLFAFCSVGSEQEHLPEQTDLATIDYCGLFETAPFKQVDHVAVVTAPRVYRMTLAILAACVVITVIGFFVTEKEKEDGKPLDSDVTRYAINDDADIHRGGEPISALEVEDHIQDPKVKEKVAFPIKHEQLGEVVALAVVTELEGEECIDLLKSLKKATNLPRDKFPEIIVKVDAFPKDGLGEVNRKELIKSVQMLLAPREKEMDCPVYAYYFVRGTIEVKDKLIGYEGDIVDEDPVDSHTKEILMAMLAMAAFGTVAYHGQLFLLYPAGTSQFGIRLVQMMCGNVIGGVRWTIQCLFAHAAFFQCQQPFAKTTVLSLIILYFSYQWPIQQIIILVFSGMGFSLPSQSWYVMTDKRWLVGVMIFCYVSFMFMRNRNYLPKSVQCGFWVVLFLIVNIWPVDSRIIWNNAPAWINFLFQDILVGGLFVWVGCVMIYFIVGHYGHGIVDRILAHPLAQNRRFQSGLRISAPVVFLAALFAQFYGPQQSTGMHFERCGKSWKWDPVTVILDQIVAVGMIGLLSQCVRCYSRWVRWIGSHALGIYLGANVIFFLPHGASEKLEGSFGIIIGKYEVLPTMQRMINWSAGLWPAMVLTVFVYTTFQIFAFGIPFHMLYLKLVLKLARFVR